MTGTKYLEILLRGRDVWKEWRKANPAIPLDFCHADLRGADLIGMDLKGADLMHATLAGARLQEAELTKAKLQGADLRGAQLVRASLVRAFLHDANLRESNLSEANLSGADLRGADLWKADVTGADLTNASLQRASLVETRLDRANLTECHIYGISAWNVKLEGAVQLNLHIAPSNEADIQVDNLEVAQLIYLLLNNKKVRGVVDTATSKVVLILGRFTPERKAVLDGIRDRLRKPHGFVPMLFDFGGPASRDKTETIKFLTSIARFVIADITDARSIAHELASIVPFFPSVPVQPLLLASEEKYDMFEHFKSYQRVLKPVFYDNYESLLLQLEKIIAHVDQKAEKLRRKLRGPEPHRSGSKRLRHRPKAEH